MSTQLDLRAGIDLLRERRLELGLQEPQEMLSERRSTLLKGTAWAAAMVVTTAVLGLLIWVRHQTVLASLDRVALVETKVAELEADLSQSRQSLAQVRGLNTRLAQALVANRSGSALMRDLQRRVPEGVQLLKVKMVSDSQLQVEGLAADPLSFARINALELQLRASPLLVPASVKLTQAERNQDDDKNTLKFRRVAFRITASLRPALPGSQEAVILRELGAEGMVQRLQLLQREGLL